MTPAADPGGSMPAASLLLLAALATQSPPPLSTTAGGAVETLQQRADLQGERGAPRTPPKAPHTFGLGGSMAVTSRGGGGNFRYFMNDRAGFSVNIGWYRPMVGSSSQ